MRVVADPRWMLRRATVCWIAALSMGGIVTLAGILGQEVRLVCAGLSLVVFFLFALIPGLTLSILRCTWAASEAQLSGLGEVASGDERILLIVPAAVAYIGTLAGSALAWGVIGHAPMLGLTIVVFSVTLAQGSYFIILSRIVRRRLSDSTITRFPERVA